MSKNKNPLKDLDLFLKQQASSFVNPTPLSEKIEIEPVQISETPDPVTPSENFMQILERMMDQNPAELYDLLIKAAEKKSTPERIMLINTALYLKNTTNWKDAITAYWQKKG
jgi:hypothetical protein